MQQVLQRPDGARTQNAASYLMGQAPGSQNDSRSSVCVQLPKPSYQAGSLCLCLPVPDVPSKAARTKAVTLCGAYTALDVSYAIGAACWQLGCALDACHATRKSGGL